MVEQEGQDRRWLSAGAAARLAGVERTTVHRAAVRGELPHAETNLGRLFLNSDVVAWRAKRERRKQ